MFNNDSSIKLTDVIRASTPGPGKYDPMVKTKNIRSLSASNS
jgi:hypothetical protein